MSATFPGAPQAQIATLLHQALAMLNAGQLGRAESTLSRVLLARPQEPDALQLLGLVRALQARPQEAVDLYKRSLSVKPNQPHVQMNLGNALANLGRKDEALAAYREAIRQKSDYVDAYVNLGGLLQASGDLHGAEKSLKQALNLLPQSVAARVGLSGVLNDLGRPHEAETILRVGLAQPLRDITQKAALEHNLGTSLKLQGRHEEALAAFDRVSALAPDLPSLHYNRGGSLQRVGRIDEAIESYRRAIKADPMSMGAHHEFNALLYRQSRDAEFLKSYDEAVTRVPRPAPLLLQKGGFLLRLERFAEAREAFEKASASEPASAGPLNGLALANAGLKQFDRAIEAYRRSLKLVPDDPTTYGNLAGALLQAGDSSSALRHAERAVALQPLDQSSLAVLDLALRANGDPRANTLFDYSRLVQVFDLEPPDGFRDMVEFNSVLNAYLDRLHVDKREHFDQTLRGGTQTLARIFDAGHDLVEALRARIEAAIATYISRMAKDESHPLFGRRRDGFGFAGSWSSRLHDCGFHTNHIHPKGWISSCYYVAVPDVTTDEAAKQGWLKLGEPSFDTPLKDPIRRAVQPLPGRLVLFPSYMWHGTIPFHSGQSRTTIAFDAVPK
jgi:tetratricopeptide (TPR) repeat protein